MPEEDTSLTSHWGVLLLLVYLVIEIVWYLVNIVLEPFEVNELVRYAVMLDDPPTGLTSKSFGYDQTKVVGVYKTESFLSRLFRGDRFYPVSPPSHIPQDAGVNN